jgi:hypothetical protein
MAFATEVDNFTDRDIPLMDSREILNFKIQRNIDEFILQTNFHYDCEKDFKNAKEYFYKNFDDKVGGYLWAKYELDVGLDPEIDKRHLSKEQSIYKYLTATDAFAL